MACTTRSILANVLVETANRTFADVPYVFIGTSFTSWDDCEARAAFALNVVRQDSVEAMPFRLAYGHFAGLPSEPAAEVTLPRGPPESGDSFLTRLQAARERASLAISLRRRRCLLASENRHHCHTFRRKIHIRGRAGNLLPRYGGLFVTMQVSGPLKHKVPSPRGIFSGRRALPLRPTFPR